MKSTCSLLFAFVLLATPLFGQPPSQKGVYLSFLEAQPILKALEEVLPEDLNGKDAPDQAAAWTKWLAQHDAQIRARLVQGDEDTLVNFLLFGTSFTRQPRLAAEDFKLSPEESGKDSSSFLSAFNPHTQAIIRTRIDDLVHAIAHPGSNERLLFLRWLAEQQDLKPDSPTGQMRLKEFAQRNLARVLTETAGYAKTLETVKRENDPNEEFIERSKLFQDRGLSLDTSLLPNFALEESLKRMKSIGLIEPGSVHRVAVIGPGLDFTDKQAGYDFYPQQTVQPFAVIDSLLRLGLANIDRLEVITLDISPRVNDHLNRARQRARQGESYTIQLPRDPRGAWKPGALRYWETFGDQIGHSVPPMPIPANLSGVALRAVRIRPAIAARINPVDLNIVTQHLSLPASQQFDLVVATNIFVYYNIFEQCLALANVGDMLKPGGFLLSNNALLELPTHTLHSVDYQTVVYSDRPDDGDHIVWYRRSQK
jgi:hypothetical protein